MEIDSKPEEMDRLERRLIQLKIQREALKKETDAASKQRLTRARRRDRASWSASSPTWRRSGSREKAAVSGDHARSRSRSSRPSWSSRPRTRAPGSRRRSARSSTAAFPTLEKQLARRAGGRDTRASPCCSKKVTAEEIAEVVSRWTGIPVSQDARRRAREAAAHGGRAAPARGRPGRGRARGGRRDPALARGPVGSEPAERLVPVPRPHRRGQDRAVQGAGRVPVRYRRRDGAHRHERVHGEALRGAPDRRAARATSATRRAASSPRPCAAARTA